MTKFKAIGGISPVPAYVDSLTSKPIHYVMGGANLGIHANGWLAAFDNPVVVQEFNRFMRKLSETIDSKNAVANIVFNETAMGVTKESLDTAYHQNLSSTQEQAVRNGYINGVIALTRQASCAFKHTPVIQLTNFPTSRLEDLTNSHLQWTVGMGGADIWLRDPSIEKRFSDANDKRLKAYDYYPKMAGKLPIGLIAAGGNYLYESHDPETMKDATLRETQTLANRYDWSPERITYELANKAIVQLRANYIFWSKLSNQGDKHYRAFINQVNKIGTSHQTIKPVVKECPSNYGGRCVQNL